MNSLLALTAVITLAAASTSAQAQEWSGFYAGVSGGYSTFESGNSDPGFTDYGDFDTDGWLVGLTAGYNIQQGSWIFGVEGDISYTDLSGDFTEANCSLLSGCSLEIEWMATLRGRAGYLVSPDVLLFATAGAAIADTEYRDLLDNYYSNTEIGAVVGAGVEAALAANWTIKGEYLYTRFGDFPLQSGGVTQIDYMETQIFRLGANYRF